MSLMKSLAEGMELLNDRKSLRESVQRHAELQIGQMYRNKNGSDYKVIDRYDKDSYWMRQPKSGWTFVAHTITMYDDGQIEWDYSTNGNFEKKVDEGKLAGRVRKNDLDYDEEIDAVYATDPEKDITVQFQDREERTHELGKDMKPLNTQPKVASKTWGRVWNKGDFEQFEGPKYVVRRDVAKYLDKIEDESLNEDAQVDNNKLKQDVVAMIKDVMKEMTPRLVSGKKFVSGKDLTKAVAVCSWRLGNYPQNIKEKVVHRVYKNIQELLDFNTDECLTEAIDNDDVEKVVDTVLDDLRSDGLVESHDPRKFRNKLNKAKFNESMSENDFLSDFYNALSNVAFKYRDYFGDLEDAKSKFEQAFEFFEIRFFDDNIEGFIDESLKEAKVDLTKIDGTTSKVLQDNIEKINNSKSKEEVYNIVKELFDKNNLKSNGAQKILYNISKQRNLEGAFSVVFNSLLSGSGNNVI